MALTQAPPRRSAAHKSTPPHAGRGGGATGGEIGAGKSRTTDPNAGDRRGVTPRAATASRAGVHPAPRPVSAMYPAFIDRVDLNARFFLGHDPNATVEVMLLDFLFLHKQS